MTKLGITALASGSSGNTTLIENNETKILIDCGLSCKETLARLNAINVSVEEIKAIFITHEHGDHTSGLKSFSNKHNIPIYANYETSFVLQKKYKLQNPCTVFENNNSFEFQGLIITPFAIPHDAVNTVAFTIEHDNKKCAVATDFGHINDFIINKLANCNSILIEFNHDKEMLTNNENRPWRIRQRTLGNFGHLNNLQSLQLLQKVLHDKLYNIIIGHISKENNCYKLIEKLINNFLITNNRLDINIHLAKQELISPTIWC